MPNPTRSAAFGMSILVTIIGLSGCNQPDEITTYTIPTKIPTALEAGKERMLAVMAPQGDAAWFFKVTGPESAIEPIAETFKSFTQSVAFAGGEPQLNELPDGWRLGGDNPMRFATITIETPEKQLEISVSRLGIQADWDQYAADNVNRWRKQLGLEASTEKWAEGEPFEMTNADPGAVWVDLTGKASAGGGSMAPFAGGAMAGGPMAGRPNAQPPMASGSVPPAAKPESKLKFDRPEGWRDGRMSMMRMAAFNVGPEDTEDSVTQAEVTVIIAGGDLRGNVARWIGQVRDGTPPDDVVDKAMEDAEKLSVSGLDATRYVLLPDDGSTGNAIDATIVPQDSGMSLFIKMTGPVETVKTQHDALTAFIESIKL